MRISAHAHNVNCWLNTHTDPENDRHLCMRWTYKARFSPKLSSQNTAFCHEERATSRFSSSISMVYAWNAPWVFFFRILDKAQSTLKIFVWTAENKGTPRILQTPRSAAKKKFLTSRNQSWRIIGVFYLLAPRVHFASTEGKIVRYISAARKKCEVTHPKECSLSAISQAWKRSSWAG